MRRTKRLQQRVAKLELCRAPEVPPFLIQGTGQDGQVYVLAVMHQQNGDLGLWQHGAGIDPAPSTIALLQKWNISIRRTEVDGVAAWCVDTAANRDSTGSESHYQANKR